MNMPSLSQDVRCHVLMSGLSASASRFAYVSIALALLSGVLWILLSAFERFIVDSSGADDVLLAIAIGSGATSGVLAASQAAYHRAKRENLPRLVWVALSLGIVAIGWNGLIWWLFVRAFLDCPNGIC